MDTTKFELNDYFLPMVQIIAPIYSCEYSTEKQARLAAQCYIEAKKAKTTRDFKKAKDSRGFVSDVYIQPNLENDLENAEKEMIIAKREALMFVADFFGEDLKD